MFVFFHELKFSLKAQLLLGQLSLFGYSLFLNIVMVVDFYLYLSLQRIALSWMVQKETNSLHCSGGILADDQVQLLMISVKNTM